MITKLLSACSARFKETEEYRVLQNYRSRDNRLSYDERMAIARSIDLTFAPLFDELKKDAPSLTPSDLQFYALSALGIENFALAECFTVSAEAIRMRKFRIREKLPSRWYELLYPEQKRNDESDAPDVTRPERNCYADVTLHPLQDQVADVNLPAESLKNTKVMKNKMSFGQAVSSCLGKYFTLEGRASRAEYWYFYLFYAIVVTIYYLIAGMMRNLAYPIMEESSVEMAEIILSVVWWILDLSLLIPIFTVTVRRLHDLDDKGWLAIILCLVSRVLMAIPKLIVSAGGEMLREVLFSSTELILSAFSSFVALNLMLMALFILRIVLLTRPGTEGPNNYGADPIIVTE